MQNAINTLLVFMIMIGAGFVLSWRGMLDEATSKKLTKIVVTVCVPATMLDNMLTYFDAETLLASWKVVLAAFCAPLLMYMLSKPAAMLLKIPKNRRGVFSTISVFSNTVFVGLPVCKALFGDEASLFALLYFLGNTLVFWTIGAFGIRRDGGFDAPLFSKETVKGIFTPAVITLLISFALLFLRVKLPEFVMKAASKLGAPGTPFAMMLAGAVIHRGFVRGTWKRWEVIPAMFLKLVALPLAMLLFVKLFGIEMDTGKILITQAMMPVMSQSTILAQLYNADDELASAGAVVSMMSLLITMPVLTLLFA